MPFFSTFLSTQATGNSAKISTGGTI
ncbi:hypothetical protein YPPY60_3458, partial [Yersinia pestis PY-60]